MGLGRVPTSNIWGTYEWLSCVLWRLFLLGDVGENLVNPSETAV